MKIINNPYKNSENPEMDFTTSAVKSNAGCRILTDDGLYHTLAINSKGDVILEKQYVDVQMSQSEFDSLIKELNICI